MTVSASLTLARLMSDARAGRPAATPLSISLKPAQAGAVLRLIRSNPVCITGAAKSAIAPFKQFILDSFAPGKPAFRLLAEPLLDVREIEKVAADWFGPNPSRVHAASGGYWLADLFLRGMEVEEVTVLARFLIGEPPSVIAHKKLTSVRRYPTGGISEKQALILPAIIRSLASDMAWCSSFLIAKRLAHTGGTEDKLGVLGGFKTVSGGSLADWDRARRPVVYLSAGVELCPRDAAMYQMRSDTGTVADVGLMAASIMSKQAAAPVDVLVLDILHGSTAFLHNLASARKFGDLCTQVGQALGISSTPLYRSADAPMGRSIGSSLEILEAIELLNPCPEILAKAEILQAIAFIQAFARGAGLDSIRADTLAREALQSGAARDSLFAIWREHGVDPALLAALESDARSQILGDLYRVDIRAPMSGFMKWNWVSLADTVNNRINRFGALNSAFARPAPGGVELLMPIDSLVRRGDIILSAFTSKKCNTLRSEILNSLSIVDCADES